MAAKATIVCESDGRESDILTAKATPESIFSGLNPFSPFLTLRTRFVAIFEGILIQSFWVTNYNSLPFFINGYYGVLTLKIENSKFEVGVFQEHELFLKIEIVSSFLILFENKIHI